MQSNIRVDLPGGWLVGAERISTNNCDERPAEQRIELIVIHNISLPPGEYGGDAIQQLFTNCLDPDGHPYYQDIHQLRVSAHLLIRRDGTAQQFVPFSQRAWHAGVSSWRGHKACNDFSIGIELEGCDDQPYDDRQYGRLGEIIPALRAAYPSIAADAIVGHSDIAPGRKTDPGPAFDWSRLRALIDS